MTGKDDDPPAGAALRPKVLATNTATAEPTALITEVAYQGGLKPGRSHGVRSVPHTHSNISRIRGGTATGNINDNR